MLMTNDEAKTKWCPMSRRVQVSSDGADEYVGTANRLRNGSVVSGDKCLGSECAMWRVVDSSEVGSEVRVYKLGFCGLAGPASW